MFRKARLLKGDIRGVTTNTVEGYYSIFKRGMKGVHQHCAEKHLHRYLSEFDFRYFKPRGAWRHAQTLPSRARLASV